MLELLVFIQLLRFAPSFLSGFINFFFWNTRCFSLPNIFMHSVILDWLGFVIFCLSVGLIVGTGGFILKNFTMVFVSVLTESRNYLECCIHVFSDLLS